MFGKLLIYLIIPVLISCFFIGGYFSGDLGLQQLIAPIINREYGLLENFQNLLLLSLIIMTGYGIIRKRHIFEKIVLGCILLMVLFLFLEEIDYGRLHYSYLIGNPLTDRGTNNDWNIHNLSNFNQFMKRGLDLFMIGFFCIFPIVSWKSKSPMVRYFRPDPWFIVIIITMFVISHLAHMINNAGLVMDGALKNNMAEFREVNIYYIFLIYLIDFIFRRKYCLNSGSAKKL